MFRRLYKTCFFAFFVVQGLFITAQNDPKKISEFDIHSYKPEPHDRIIFEVNHTGWLNMPHNLKETATSGGVNILLYFDYPLGNSHFSFAWGAGLSSHNIHGKINLVYQVDSLHQQTVFTSVEPRYTPYKINRIGFKVIEVPLEFRFRTRTPYQFKLMAGVKVGYVVQTFKKVFDADGKVKVFDIFGVNLLRYGVQLRMGWEQLHLSVFYALSEVFEKGKGSPGIIPFSIGLAYTPRISLGNGAH